MLSSSTAGERRTNGPGYSDACLIRFTRPSYVKLKAASNRRVCWISAVGAGGSCGKCTTLGQRHTLLGSIRRKACWRSHANSHQRRASTWVPVRHCHWRKPRSISRSRLSRFITGTIRLPGCVRSPALCDLVAPFCSLISPYPPGLHGCFHVLDFTARRRCVRFLKRRVWKYRCSQLLVRALCAAPSGRSQPDEKTACASLRTLS